MSNVVLFPIEGTKLFKWASDIANLAKKGRAYEINLYALYNIPDQLKSQVQIIAVDLIKNDQTNR